MVWCLFIQHHCTFYIAYITQDAERDMHEVEYLYMQHFPEHFSSGNTWGKNIKSSIIQLL